MENLTLKNELYRKVILSFLCVIFSQMGWGVESTEPPFITQPSQWVMLNFQSVTLAAHYDSSDPLPYIYRFENPSLSELGLSGVTTREQLTDRLPQIQSAIDKLQENLGKLDKARRELHSAWQKASTDLAIAKGSPLSTSEEIKALEEKVKHYAARVNDVGTLEKDFKDRLKNAQTLQANAKEQLAALNRAGGSCEGSCSGSGGASSDNGLGAMAAMGMMSSAMSAAGKGGSSGGSQQAPAPQAPAPQPPAPAPQISTGDLANLSKNSDTGVQAVLDAQKASTERLAVREELMAKDRSELVKQQAEMQATLAALAAQQSEKNAATAQVQQVPRAPRGRQSRPNPINRLLASGRGRDPVKPR